MIKSIVRDRRGAGTVEYAVLVGLLALVVLGAVKIFGTTLKSKIEGQAKTVSGIQQLPAARSSASAIRVANRPELRVSWVLMSLWHLLLFAAVAVAGVAAVIDWRTGEIPNWLTFGGVVAGLVGNFVLGFRTGGLSEGGAAIGWSFAGVIACGFVPVLLFRVGGIGGGDLKLLLAIGALLRPTIGIEAELYSFVAVALYAPARLVYEGRLLRSLGNALSLLTDVVRPEEKRKKVDPELLSTVRFGPCVFLGTVIAAIVNMRLF